MPVVKVGPGRQVVIPKRIHDQLGLEAGDALEVALEEGKVVFTPRTVVEKRISEGMEDLKRGRIYGPFHSTQEMIRSLRGASKRPNRPKKS